MPDDQCPECEEGAPGWIVTYGDLMTLLLCFFVMLFAMSEIKTVRFAAVMMSFQSYIGKHVSQGISRRIMHSSGTQKVQKINLRGKEDKKGIAKIDSIFGQHSSTTRLKPGLKISLGGKTMFEHGSARLKPEARAFLRKIGRVILGFRNKIEVRGHASTEPLPADSPYRDKWDLSLARARNTARFLIDECRINESRIRISGASIYEALEENFVEEERMQNRRVEIIVTEEYIVFQGEKNAGR